MKKQPTELDLLLEGKELAPDTIMLYTAPENGPILELRGNGDILVKGKLIENDKEVVDAMREFLKHQGYIK